VIKIGPHRLHGTIALANNALSDEDVLYRTSLGLATLSLDGF